MKSAAASPRFIAPPEIRMPAAASLFKPDPDLQGLVEILTRSMSVPIAFVYLHGETEPRFAAGTGMDFTNRDSLEAFSKWYLKQTSHPQTAAHEAFADFAGNTGVSGLQFHEQTFFPLNGKTAGCICLLDVKQRTLKEAELKLLDGAAATIAGLLELHPVPSDSISAPEIYTHYLEREFHELMRNNAAAFKFFKEAALDGVWYWDLDNPENEWLSPRFKRVFGYNVDEMENSPEWWQQAIHPDDLETVLRNFEAHRDDPSKPFVQDVRYRHRNGSTVWIRCRGLIIRDAEGKPRRMYGAHTDITELKKLEREASERASLVTAILDTVEEGVMLFSGVRNSDREIVDLVFLEANSASLAMTGRERNDLIGSTLSAAFPGNFETGIFLDYKRALEEKLPVHFEIHYTHEGLDHWFSVRAAPTNKDQLVVTFVDISALKRSNVELERKGAELRFILDTIPVRVWLKGENSEILRLNKAAANSLGLTVDEVEGMLTEDLPVSMTDRYSEEDRHVVESGEPILGMLERFEADDGHKGWIRTDKFPLPESLGLGKGIIGVSIDVTNEQTALHNLEIANSSLKQFAVLASHDLQAPLRQITFLADTLIEDYADDMPEDASKTLGRMQRIVGTMRTLVRDLLDFSSEPISPNDLEPVALTAIANEVAERVDADLKEQEGTLSINLPDAQVLGKHPILCQVLLNLIGNSLKFRSDAAPAITITGKSRGAMIEIAVEDNGIGLKPELHDTAFKLFGRAHHKAVSGNGIGLAFCRKAITAFGGTISFDPKQTEGCRILITLALV